MELKRSFKHGSEGSDYTSTTDSLILAIKDSYSGCFVGMDTSQIVERLGRYYFLETPAFGRGVRDSLGLRLAIIYVVTTPNHPLSRTNPVGWEIKFGVDSFNLVRIVRVGETHQIAK